MKEFTGTVVSDRMDKTIVVNVTRMWLHPKYKKTVKRTKKYLVHDERQSAKVGDQVIFTQSRPLSKRKQFTLKTIIDLKG
jgi:small subunit ribosomal protein S17